MGNFKNTKPKQKRKKGKKFVYNPNQATNNPATVKPNPFEEAAKKKLVKQGGQFDELVSEYKNRFNSNSFIDNRIGEGSKNLSYDDKMKLRFKAQQMINQKLKKKNKYSIMNDEEEDTNLHTLTHKGKEIDNGRIDMVKEQSDDDEYYEQLDNYRQELEENPTGVRLSRKEILQNIINKSKMLKMEKQKLKAENLNNIEMLDENFGELSSLLLRRKRTFGKFNDDYDKMASNYLYSKKTTPTDRIKSEKEVLLENEMKLEKQNKQKIKEALLDSDEDNKIEKEEHPDENEQSEKKKLTKKERIDKLIAERLAKTQKITKEELIKKKPNKDDQDDEEPEDQEDEDEDNMSDLKEFEEDANEDGEEYDEEDGEEYDEEEEFEEGDEEGDDEDEDD